MSSEVEIPNRPLFKASEVCDLARVQPYVLRSWEAEFKDLGVARSGSTTRVYRREDVERVLRIRHLLLVEGLTLAGVRRKLEEEAEAETPLTLDAPPDAAAADAPIVAEARACIGDVRKGLRSLLDLLDAPVRAADETPEADASAEPQDLSLFPPESEAAPASRRPARRAAAKSATEESAKSSSPRRKRSA